MQILIAELSSDSPRFRELWARANVGYPLGMMHMRHPQVGDLYVHRNQLNVPHVPHALGQHLLIYRAEPGSDTARALEQLRSGQRAIAVPSRRHIGHVGRGSSRYLILLPNVRRAGPRVSAAATATTIATKQGGPRVRK
jgi:MmyB-like transcription regulator ligand binding domain